MRFIPSGWQFVPMVLVVLVGCRLRAQALNEFDFEPAALPLTTIPPNGATHTITTAVTYTGQHLRLNAPLTVRAGAELRLQNCSLEVAGSVLLEDGGRLTVIDSSLLLPCTFQVQYEFRIEGGVLHTERAVIGCSYVGTNLFHTRLLHLRGTWLARQTVVQSLVTILSDGRNGWYGDPRFKGGSVFADGLYEGDRTDAIHMSGMGDAVLENGAMNVGLYYDASAAGQPASATLDLDGRAQLAVVYGDPVVHTGVTAPLVGAACRLELRNHRVPTWQFFAVNASSAGALQTLTLRHAEDILCSVRGSNLTGTPVLGGPWASYYADLPGLPSTGRPGHHALPPACSVRIGNVQFQSGPGPDDGNRIRAWGLYARGTGTNLTVQGPASIAEINLSEGRMHLVGTGSFDMGVFANVVRIYAGASLQIDNASLGEFGIGSGSAGIIEASTGASCTITNSRTAPVRLRTISANASITTQNVFGTQNFTIDTAGGGTVQVQGASQGQDTDLQNLGFESPLLAGNVPPYWSSQAIAGTLVADVAPGAAGSRSYEAVAQSSAALLQKHLTLPPGTSVTVIGATKMVQTPTSGQLLWRASQGANAVSRAAALNQPNSWQRVHVPVFTVGALPGPVAVQCLATGLPTTARLDDVRVQIGSWWDDDNFANLDFEMECRSEGQVPTYWSEPDCWRSFQARCSSDPGVLRPGAAPGSRSVRMVLQAGSGTINKNLTFLRAGDQLVVTGYARGTGGAPGSYLQAIVQNGGSGSPVQFSALMPCDGAWHAWSVNYTVPANAAYTRLLLTCFDAPLAQCWFDDVTVEVR